MTRDPCRPPWERTRRTQLDRDIEIIGRLLKPWLVRREGDDCQILFPLTKLDTIAAAISAAMRGEEAP